MVRDRVLAVARADRLPDLAGAQPLERAGLDAHGLRAEVGQEVMGKAMASGETEGFAKVVADGKTGRLVGLHVIGEQAENLVQEGTLALRMGATLTDIAELIHPHPTMTEAIGEAAMDALGRAIHKM